MGTASRLLLSLSILTCLLFAAPGRVEGQNNACPGTSLRWEELRTASFALLYPENGDGQALLESLRGEIEGEYARFAKLFDASLQLPVNIRVYPDEKTFTCLNSGVVRSPRGLSHASVGTREIALILSNFNLDLGSRPVEALNAARYELAGLFAQQVTDRKASPGLVAGIGGYAQDPDFFLRNRLRSLAPGALPADWNALWNDPNVPADPALSLEATTTIAYLVDVFGWQNFLQFLKDLAAAGEYRQALADVYETGPVGLQEQWLQYVPYYLQGRWRAHALYSFDLSSFEKMMQSGAYEDAAAGLKSAIDFLDSSGETQKAQQARELLQKAQAGQEAAVLVRRARAALLDGQYDQAVTLSEQARVKYGILQDERRMEELRTYQDWGKEIVALRNELSALDRQVRANALADPSARLREIGKRLSELGDDASRRETNELLALIGQRAENRRVAALGAGALVVMGLLALRLLLMRRKRPAEALL